MAKDLKPPKENIPEAVVDWIIANNIAKNPIDTMAVAVRLRDCFEGMEGYADALFDAYSDSAGVAKTKLLTVIGNFFEKAVGQQEAEIKPQDLNDEQLEAVVRFMVERGMTRDESSGKDTFGT